MPPRAAGSPSRSRRSPWVRGLGSWGDYPAVRGCYNVHEMLDIVEIALSGVTDFSDFEKLASEVVRSEGYPNINPLGGQNDAGRDAVDERLWLQEGRRATTVFQITTQETVEAKVKSQVEDLTQRIQDLAS